MMFLRFLKKKNQEDNKIQELEQTIHKLEMEIDRLKSDVIKAAVYGVAQSWTRLK